MLLWLGAAGRLAGSPELTRGGMAQRSVVGAKAGADVGMTQRAPREWSAAAFGDGPGGRRRRQRLTRRRQGSPAPARSRRSRRPVRLRPRSPRGPRSGDRTPPHRSFRPPSECDQLQTRAIAKGGYDAAELPTGEVELAIVIESLRTSE